MTVGYTPDEVQASTQAAEDALEANSQIREDYIATFSTPAGERVLRDLYRWCRQNRSTYSQGQDVTHTAFLEGRRSVVLRIMECIHMDDMDIIRRAREAALRGGRA